MLLPRVAKPFSLCAWNKIQNALVKEMQWWKKRDTHCEIWNTLFSRHSGKWSKCEIVFKWRLPV